MTDWKRIGVIIAGLGFAASLLMNVSTIVKATPSRAEMIAADQLIEQRTQRELTEIKSLVTEIRNLQLEMLMGAGGDTRGEGN